MRSFPFRDGLDAATQAGITAVIQPGGSIRDAEIIKAADEHGRGDDYDGHAPLPALTDVETTLQRRSRLGKILNLA